MAHCRETLLTGFAGVQRDNAIKQHPDRCSSSGVGQHITRLPSGLRARGSGSPRSFSARSPELRFSFPRSGGKSTFQQSNLCFLTCWCHAVSLEERWCGMAPLTGSSRFAFARFGHERGALRSQASCAASGFPGCCLILRTVCRECDIVFPPAVTDKSQCEFWIYLAELSRASFMLLRFVQIIWTNIFFLLRLVPVCL